MQPEGAEPRADQAPPPLPAPPVAAPSAGLPAPHAGGVQPAATQAERLEPQPAVPQQPHFRQPDPRPAAQQPQFREPDPQPRAPAAAAASAPLPPRQLPRQPPEGRHAFVTGVALGFHRALPGSGRLEPVFVPGLTVALEEVRAAVPGPQQQAQPGAAAGVRLAVYDGGGAELAALADHPCVRPGCGAPPPTLPSDPRLGVHIWDSGAAWWLLFPDPQLAQAFKGALLAWAACLRGW